MHPVLIVLSVILMVGLIGCLIFFGIRWFKKYIASREEKRIRHGVELLKQYVVMMDRAEDLCDAQMAYDAFRIGMEACKFLHCTNTTEARYYYLSE